MVACSSIFEMRLLFTPALTKLLFTFIQNEFVRFNVCCCILFRVGTEQEAVFVVVIFFFKFAFEVDKSFSKYALNSMQVFA